jgi:hypothetical protein
MSSGVVGLITWLALALQTGPFLSLRALGHLRKGLGLSDHIPILLLDGGALFRELWGKSVPFAQRSFTGENAPMSIAENVITLFGLLFIVTLTLFALWLTSDYSPSRSGGDVAILLEEKGYLFAENLPSRFFFFAASCITHRNPLSSKNLFNLNDEP